MLGKPASSDNNSDLTWAALGTVFYIAGLVVVLPIFAFTLGRWLDRKTWRDTRRAAVRFGIYGGDDDVSPIRVGDRTLFIGLPPPEGRMMGELLGAGDVGCELSLDPVAPVVIGVYPMRPVPRS